LAERKSDPEGDEAQGGGSFHNRGKYRNYNKQTQQAQMKFITFTPKSLKCPEFIDVRVWQLCIIWFL
jgi:hypothetical protein